MGCFLCATTVVAAPVIAAAAGEVDNSRTIGQIYPAGNLNNGSRDTSVWTIPAYRAVRDR